MTNQSNQNVGLHSTCSLKFSEAPAVSMHAKNTHVLKSADVISFPVFGCFVVLSPSASLGYT